MFVRRIIVNLAIIIMAFSLLPIGSVLAQTTTSPWSSSSNSVQKIEEFGPTESIVNRPELKVCFDHTFPLQPARPLIRQEAEYYYGCAHRSKHGPIAGQYWHANGTKVAGKFTEPFGISGFLPVGYGEDLLGITSRPAVGSKVSIVKDFASNLNSSVSAEGKVTYTLTRSGEHVLKDKSGAELWTHPGSIGFSQNGKWMTADIPGVSHIRVDLETFEVTSFASSYNYFAGYSVTPKTVISDDGRWALVYTIDTARFELYDLDTCTNTPNRITTYANCRSKDLYQYMRSQTQLGNNFAGVTGVKFIDPYSISFMGVYRDANNIRSPGRFLLAAAPEYASQMGYLALGDSYSSGEGANDYEEYSNTDDNRCHISKNSYPYSITKNLGFNEFGSIACSGGTTYDVTSKSLDYSGQARNAKEIGDLTPSEFTDYIANYMPGYIIQAEFVQAHKPKNVTITIGGNDISFSDILARCTIFIDNCYGTYEQRLALINAVNEKYPDLTETYKLLKSSSLPNTNIYVVGYPQFAEIGDCGNNVRLSSMEIEFGSNLVSYLNNMIERAALKEGVRYVDIEDALEGGRLCSGKVGPASTFHGITPGRERWAVLSAATFHPTAKGQFQMHQKILERTANFTQTNPLPNTSLSSMPNITDDHVILNVPRSGESPSKTVFSRDLEQELFIKEQDNYIQIGDVLLERNATYEAWLHSEPQYLGTLTSDNQGILSGNISIPSNIASGFHTLHIYGKNIAGENVDIQKFVYVATSADDFDGDKTNNEQDTCPGFSTADEDGDGIDNMCDNEFTVQEENQNEQVQTPTEPEENEPVLLEEDPKDTLATQPSQSNPQSEVGEETQATPAAQPAPSAPTARPAPRRVVTLATAPSAPSPTQENTTAQVAGASTTLAQTTTSTQDIQNDIAQQQAAKQQNFSWLGYAVMFVVVVGFGLLVYRTIKRS